MRKLQLLTLSKFNVPIGVYFSAKRINDFAQHLEEENRGDEKNQPYIHYVPIENLGAAVRDELSGTFYEHLTTGVRHAMVIADTLMSTDHADRDTAIIDAEIRSTVFHLAAAYGEGNVLGDFYKFLLEAKK